MVAGCRPFAAAPSSSAPMPIPVLRTVNAASQLTRLRFIAMLLPRVVPTHQRRSVFPANRAGDPGCSGSAGSTPKAAVYGSRKFASPAPRLHQPTDRDAKAAPEVQTQRDPKTGQVPGGARRTRPPSSPPFPGARRSGSGWLGDRAGSPPRARRSVANHAETSDSWPRCPPRRDTGNRRRRARRAGAGGSSERLEV